MPKPCPFCGGTPELVRCEEGCCGGRPRWIKCTNERCWWDGFFVDADTAEEAWAQWDTRQGEP